MSSRSSSAFSYFSDASGLCSTAASTPPTSTPRGMPAAAYGASGTARPTTSDAGDWLLDDESKPLPLRELCARLHARIQAFLDEDVADDARLRQVQAQTRGSLGILRTALERYR